MNHFEQAKAEGFAWRNFQYGADELKGGTSLLQLEALLVAILVGILVGSWVIGLLIVIFFPIMVARIKILRIVCSVLFSTIFSSLLAWGGFTLGHFLDKSNTAGWVLAVLVGVISFSTFMMKHGWGFLAVNQEFERGRQTAEARTRNDN